MENKITKQDIKDLTEIRNYFGEHDKTIFEHTAYAKIDKILKKLNGFPYDELIKQLDIWIEDCQFKTDFFSETGLEASKIGSSSMKYAYEIVKKFVKDIK